MKTTTIKKSVFGIVGVIALTSLFPLFAQMGIYNNNRRGDGEHMMRNYEKSNNSGYMGNGMQGNASSGNLMMNTMNGMVGTVTEIHGLSFVLHARQKMNIDEKTYTVDASKAIFYKNNATESVASLAIGDSIVVHGTTTNAIILAHDVTILSTSSIGFMMRNATNTGNFSGQGKGMMHNARGYVAANTNGVSAEHSFMASLKQFFSNMFR